MDTAPHGQGTPRDGEGGMIKLLSIHGNGNGSTPILFGILRFPRLPQLFALLVSAFGPIVTLTTISGVMNSIEPASRQLMIMPRFVGSSATIMTSITCMQDGGGERVRTSSRTTRAVRSIFLVIESVLNANMRQERGLNLNLNSSPLVSCVQLAMQMPASQTGTSNTSETIIQRTISVTQGPLTTFKPSAAHIHNAFCRSRGLCCSSSLECCTRQQSGFTQEWRPNSRAVRKHLVSRRVLARSLALGSKKAVRKLSGGTQDWHSL